MILVIFADKSVHRLQRVTSSKTVCAIPAVKAKRTFVGEPSDITCKHCKVFK